MWFDYLGSHRDALDPEVHEFTFRRIRDRQTSLRGLVAAGPDPVGFVHYYFHPSSYNKADACTVEDLYVAPSARGAGVGRWMIERVAQLAAAAGAPALHWKTARGNAAAIALYRKLAVQADVYSFKMPLQAMLEGSPALRGDRPDGGDGTFQSAAFRHGC